MVGICNASDTSELNDDNATGGLQRAADLFAPWFRSCAIDSGLYAGEFPITALKNVVIIVFNTVYANRFVIKLVC
jgi:hypothetical protein